MLSGIPTGEHLHVADISIAELKASLAALPPKATSPSSARALVEAIAAEIRTAMDRGYTYQEIAALLAERGLVLKPNTLRLYLQPRKKTPVRRAGKGRKAAAGAPARAAPVAPGAGAHGAGPPAHSAPAAAAAPGTPPAHQGAAVPGALRTDF
jgi:hypothetical protein